MQDILRGVTSRLSIGVATAIVTTVVVAGGLAYASQTESVPNGSVTTAKIANGAVTRPKIANNAVNSGKIADGTIALVDLSPAVSGQLGVPGPAGPAGPAGPPGPAGAAARFAHVNSGSGGSVLINGRGVSNVGRVGTGQYTVTFTDSVASCGLIATLTDNATGISSNGEISAERDNNNTVRVRTYNSAGVSEDTFATDGFTLMLAC